MLPEKWRRESDELMVAAGFFFDGDVLGSVR
jgi:hypothetical protein